MKVILTTQQTRDQAESLAHGRSRCIAVAIAIATILVTGCGRSIPLTTEERNYLARVDSIELPLQLSNYPGASDTIRSRALQWMALYSPYPVATRSGTEVATLLPTDPLQGGHGFTVSWGLPKDLIVVTIKAYIADRNGRGTSIIDPVPARMLGLYLRDGILPPNDRVGFSR